MKVSDGETESLKAVESLKANASSPLLGVTTRNWAQGQV